MYTRYPLFALESCAHFGFENVRKLPTLKNLRDTTKVSTTRTLITQTAGDRQKCLYTAIHGKTLKVLNKLKICFCLQWISARVMDFHLTGKNLKNKSIYKKETYDTLPYNSS